MINGKKLLSSRDEEASSGGTREEPMNLRDETPPSPIYAYEPRDTAIRYYSRMRNEANFSYEFVYVLIRTNRRKYETKEDACEAIIEEIEYNGNKCEDWVLHYKQDSGLLDIYNSREVDIKRYCRDIENCLREIDSILGFPDKYDSRSVHNRLTTIRNVFKNCIAIAERELEKLGIQVQ